MAHLLFLSETRDIRSQGGLVHSQGVSLGHKDRCQSIYPVAAQESALFCDDPEGRESWERAALEQAFGAGEVSRWKLGSLYLTDLGWNNTHKDTASLRP